MKKIALPTEKNELGSYFGSCKQFKLYHIENDKVISETTLLPPFCEPELLPAWLSEKGITDIITSGIEYTAASIFKLNGVNVIIGTPVKENNEIIQDFINGTIETDNTNESQGFYYQ